GRARAGRRRRVCRRVGDGGGRGLSRCLGRGHGGGRRVRHRRGRGVDRRVGDRGGVAGRRCHRGGCGARPGRGDGRGRPHQGDEYRTVTADHWSDVQAVRVLRDGGRGDEGGGGGQRAGFDSEIAGGERAVGDPVGG